MKVMHLNTYDDPAEGSGAERIMFAIAEGFRDRGIQNTLVGIGLEKSLCRFERDGMIIWRAPIKNIYRPTREKQFPMIVRRIWHLFDTFNVGMKSQILQILKEDRPDICLIHGLSGWSISVVSAFTQLGIPVVQVLHDFYYVCPNTVMRRSHVNCDHQCISCRLLRIRHRNLSNKLSAVVGVSHFILDSHSALGYFKDVVVREVVHNVSATVPSCKSLKEYSGSPEKVRGLKFGFIGTVAEHKGIELLLKTFCEGIFDNSELLIAGQGKHNYVEFLQKRWNRDNIRYLGQVQPERFFDEIDICVVPSLWNENFPGVICESLAFGVPVIGSKRGGIPEQITHGENGFLFNPNNSGELLQLMKMCESMSLKELLNISNKSQNSYAAFQSKSNWITKYISILNKACSEYDKTYKK
jgi:glycosyltransferase involved in cell wall biosynthesis